MKALIVDAEELYRLSLREVISVSGNFHEILEAGSEHEFLARTAHHADFSLIIVHPGSLGEDGEDCLKLAKRLYPDAAIVVILDRAGQAAMVPNGVPTVHRGASVSQIVMTIRRALKLPLDGFGTVASQPAAPNVRRMMDMPAPRSGDSSLIARRPDSDIDFSRLSYRQKQILAMAADGLPNKEIAARLSIAEGTVKAHMHAIFKVLGVQNRTQAVIRYGAAGRAQAARNQEMAYATAS
ncbi:helix-turn-helix transcriptional regulator [Kordiimonas marina]|uniref:helix-turn-helix transcriptional regulator n=1 Tax=Kordiimonas marina TaxID=2872312 RepID=UPI001FF24B8F|nr:response regulator transcription factor [Kordiimonas marina]MCJ9429728.1 response regulator transcription factor [Kordiimonas marina]